VVALQGNRKWERRSIFFAERLFTIVAAEEEEEEEEE
jgi:hypothetical protein